MFGKSRNMLLRIAACGAVFSFIYPAVVILRVLLFKDDAGTRGILLSAAVALCGILITTAIVNSRKELRYNIAAYMVIILPIFIFIAVYRDTVWRSLFEGAVAALFYFFGIRSYYIPYNAMLSSKRMIAGTVILGIALSVVMYYGEFKYLSQMFFAFVYFFIFLLVVVKTQENLDKVFIRRHIEISSVPKNIRNFNNGISILLFLAAALIVNVKGMLGYIARGMKNLFIGFLWLVIKVLGFIFNPSDSGNESMPQNDTANPVLPFIEDGEQNTMVSNIIYGIVMAVIAAVIIYAIYPRIPYIISAVADGIKRALAFIKKYLRTLLKLPESEDEIGEDYQDMIERLEPAKRTGSIKRGHRVSPTRRRLRKSTDPSERIRLMYKNVLTMLGEIGIKIEKADTVGEIYKKSAAIEGMGRHLGELTHTYEKVRYGEAIPEPEEVTSSEKSYSLITDRISKSHI